MRKLLLSAFAVVCLMLPPNTAAAQVPDSLPPEVTADMIEAGAAVYAGIDPRRVIVITMCISGALAGFVALNELAGVQHRLLLNFTAGYGFTGIAV